MRDTAATADLGEPAEIAVRDFAIGMNQRRVGGKSRHGSTPFIMAIAGQAALGALVKPGPACLATMSAGTRRDFIFPEILPPEATLRVSHTPGIGPDELAPQPS